MACAIIALVTVRRNSTLVYKLLAAFMVLTALHSVIMPVLGHLQIRNHFQQNNYMHLRFPLLALVYYLSFRRFNSRGVWLCILLWCLTPVFLWTNCRAMGWNTVHTPYLVAGSATMIACILMYLYHMFASDTVRPTAYPLFWSSIGLLFLFLTVIPSVGLLNLLVANNLLLAQHAAISLVFVNYITYSMIAADFIIQWKQQKAADLSASR
jgi:hypothetical protein